MASKKLADCTELTEISASDWIPVGDTSASSELKKVSPATLTNMVLTQSNLNNIGVPGGPGFGVGICNPDDLPSGMTPLSGCYDRMNDNYGNYQYSDGSVMVYVPKFYYKVGTGANGLAVNVVDVKPSGTYADTAAANADGYALHRAFKDGGAEKPGFFVDKFMVSKVAKGTGWVGASIKNGLPLSTASAHNPMSELTASGGTNAYWRTIDCAKARDGVNGAANPSSIFFVTSRFIHAALALLSLSHGQASTSTAFCAWYLSGSIFPKGCNNDALRDVNDTSVLYTTDGYLNCGRTGSGVIFAKTTHNGQNCGVADLNGLMWEISLGITCIATTHDIEGMSAAAACEITITGHGLVDGDYVQINAITQADWSGCKDKIWAVTRTGDNTFTIPFNSSGFGTPYDPITDPGTITKGTFYIAKEATAMKSFTSGATLATDHWGATGVAAMMDAFVPPFKTASGGIFAQRYGSSTNQVFSEAVSGSGYALTGAGLPKDANGIDTSGTATFGQDYYYQYLINSLCCLACGSWNNSTSAGVWSLFWHGARTASHYSVGWRCACYPV